MYGYSPYLTQPWPGVKFALAFASVNMLSCASFMADVERDAPRPLFNLGQVVSTPGAIQTMQDAGQDPGKLLHRHVTGDWGDLGEEDKQENDFSVDKSLRIFSAYELANGEKVWLITEADRSSTTIFLPEEY